MSGLVGFTGPPDQELLDRMLKLIAHRGALRQSLVTDHGTLAVVEWDHLTGLDSTLCVASRNGGVAVSGKLFQPPPDHLSPNTLSHLRGSFSIAELDSGHLRIARDPVGTQSLYYGWVPFDSLPDSGPNRWLVATEPKAITSHPAFDRIVRPAALAQYLTFSFIPGHQTMLEKLYQVEAGSMVNLHSERQPERISYFLFELEEEAERFAGLSERDWIQSTRTHLETAVAERLPDGEVAVALSGGLDSSIVAAEVARQATGPVHTFSIHFGKRYPNELEYARSVAQRIGSRHHEILIRPRDFLTQFRRMIWHLDEPIGDPITQPNYQLASIVGRDFPLLFNGEGGDPLFGGPKNLTMLLHHWYGAPDRPDGFREQWYLASYRRAYEEWSRLLSPEIRCLIDPARDLDAILTPYFRTNRPRRFLNKLMAINIRLKGANLILPKVDRMLAAHRLMPLSPLFDDQLTRLSFQMPALLKLRNGIEKFALKEAYRDRLPAGVIERPKSGMRVPVHYWFRGEMRRFARRQLSRHRLRHSGYLDPDRVHQILSYQTEEGPGRFGLRLWMLLTLEVWRQLVVERQPV